MPSIRDALDGTLLAKKVAQELEPVDAWAAPVVAEAAPVATSADGERLVVLGAVAAAAKGEPGATGQLEAHETGPAPPRRGRPPGGTTPKRVLRRPTRAIAACARAASRTRRRRRMSGASCARAAPKRHASMRSRRQAARPGNRRPSAAPTPARSAGSASHGSMWGNIGRAANAQRLCVPWQICARSATGIWVCGVRYLWRQLWKLRRWGGCGAVGRVVCAASWPEGEP